MIQNLDASNLPKEQVDTDFRVKFIEIRCFSFLNAQTVGAWTAMTLSPILCLILGRFLEIHKERKEKAWRLRLRLIELLHFASWACLSTTLLYGIEIVFSPRVGLEKNRWHLCLGSIFSLLTGYLFYSKKKHIPTVVQSRKTFTENCLSKMQVSLIYLTYLFGYIVYVYLAPSVMRTLPRYLPKQPVWPVNKSQLLEPIFISSPLKSRKAIATFCITFLYVMSSFEGIYQTTDHYYFYNLYFHSALFLKASLLSVLWMVVTNYLFLELKKIKKIYLVQNLEKFKQMFLFIGGIGITYFCVKKIDKNRLNEDERGISYWTILTKNGESKEDTSMTKKIKKRLNYALIWLPSISFYWVGWASYVFV